MAAVAYIPAGIAKGGHIKIVLDKPLSDHGISHFKPRADPSGDPCMEQGRGGIQIQQDLGTAGCIDLADTAFDQHDVSPFQTPQIESQPPVGFFPAFLHGFQQRSYLAVHCAYDGDPFSLHTAFSPRSSPSVRPACPLPRIWRPADRAPYSCRIPWAWRRGSSLQNRQ